MSSHADAGTLASIASIISAFGTAMLFFRIERELQVAKEEEHVWLLHAELQAPKEEGFEFVRLPYADWLLVGATLIFLLFVILPLLICRDLTLPTAASGAATTLVAGYVLAILCHYRIAFDKNFVIFGDKRKGKRTNPEPSERFFVGLFLAAGIAVFIYITSI